jgi:hypothetical protein
MGSTIARVLDICPFFIVLSCVGTAASKEFIKNLNCDS